jgi:putative SOS response-associated peptidase YedK
VSSCGPCQIRLRIAESFRAKLPPGFEIHSSYNVAPQTFQPVIRLDSEGEREIVLMRWGLIPFWMLLAKSVTRRILQFGQRRMCVSQPAVHPTNSPSNVED